MLGREPASCPDFFLLGAAKAGTTSLHHWLSQHPDVCMSEPKEPFFFEAEYERGLGFYLEKYFRHCHDKQLLGGARHRNLYLPYVPARIRASCRDPKFIAILRNPVDRAYSHWWHWYRLGQEDLPFGAAIRADAERIEAGFGVFTPEDIAEYVQLIGTSGRGPYRTYLDSGYYAEQLERYFGLFPRNRFKIVLFEQLVADPTAVVREICEFLGVDAAARIDYAARNTEGRLSWRHAKDKILSEVVKAFRAEPSVLISRAGWSRLLSRPPMGPDTRNWLHQHFQPHNTRLAELLDVDLAAWESAADSWQSGHGTRRAASASSAR
jgi:hypothetical protein